MNRREKRLSEKREKRGIGNDTASTFSREILEEAHLSQELQRLVQSAAGPISAILNGIYDPAFPLKPREVVIALLDSSSPLAPPELKKAGKKGYATTQLKREGLAMAMANNPLYADVVRDLNKPGACGHDDHVDLFVSTQEGGLLKCAECDLGFKRGQRGNISGSLGRA